MLKRIIAVFLFQAQSYVLPRDGGVDIRFRNLLQLVLGIYRTHGIYGFYHGLLANSLKVGDIVDKGGMTIFCALGYNATLMIVAPKIRLVFDIANIVMCELCQNHL